MKIKIKMIREEILNNFLKLFFVPYRTSKTKEVTLTLSHFFKMQPKTTNIKSSY